MTRSAPPLSARRRWAVLAVVLFAAIVDLADGTITTIYFQTRDGTVLSLAVVAALTLACCGLVRRMPRHARVPEDRR